MNKEITIYAWNVAGGGLLKAMFEEYNYFKRKGYGVKVIFFCAEVPDYYSNLLRAMNPIILSRSSKSLKFFSLVSDTPGFTIPIKAFFSGSKLLMKDKSFVISHELTSGFSLFLYSTLYRGRVAVVLHDNPFAFLSAQSFERKYKFLMKFLTIIIKFLLFPFKIFIATTPAILKSFSNDYPNKDIQLAEYGVNICFEAPPILSRSEILVLTKWARWRKPEKYLEIAGLLGNNFNLVLAGHWDDSDYYNEIERIAVSMGPHGAHITFKRDLSEDETHNLYHNCRVFLRLSFSEKGTGQGILDAIGHGCVLIIGKELGGLSGITDGVHGYIVDSNNSEDIVEKIRRIFESNEVAQTFSSNVYKFATKHTWNDYGKALERGLFGGSDGNL